MDARQAAERAVRESYGRLLAFLTTRCRDVAQAEDALSGALVSALETWPTAGIPEAPIAWLLTVARRQLLDRQRSDRVRERHEALLEFVPRETPAIEEMPEERLRVLFVCAHPAIDESLHAAMMLQTVLGLDAARIAQAFLISPTTMGQRLVRAKAKIRDAGISFDLPAVDVLRERLPAVLDAIYAAFGSDWEAPDAFGLAPEAILLARLLVRLLPDEAEARGLLALLLFTHARRAARRDTEGAYIPLCRQDPLIWELPLLAEAESQLQAASRYRTIGRFQLEAAIQSVHAARRFTGKTDRLALTTLYDGLLHIAPSIGAIISRAAIAAESETPEDGFVFLDRLAPERIAAHQPYWAVRAHLLARTKQYLEADAAYETAIRLTDDASVKAYLQTEQQSVRAQHRS